MTRFGEGDKGHCPSQHYIKYHGVTAEEAHSSSMGHNNSAGCKFPDAICLWPLAPQKLVVIYSEIRKDPTKEWLDTEKSVNIDQDLHSLAEPPREWVKTLLQPVIAVGICMFTI